MQFESSQELLHKVKTLDLYEKLVLQIEKDFLRANIDIKIGASMSGIELEEKIQEKLYVLLLERFDEYLNLLYVIDISENNLEYIRTSDVVEVSKQMCFFILKREFQKVWYKSQYS